MERGQNYLDQSFQTLRSLPFFTYGLGQVLEDTAELKFNDIPVWEQWDEPPTPQAKILFDNIWEKVFNQHSEMQTVWVNKS